jgi:hypothetical protein
MDFFPCPVSAFFSGGTVNYIGPTPGVMANAKLPLTKHCAWCLVGYGDLEGNPYVLLMEGKL